ncbi:hypothetical protein [Nostoc sp.]|uniref:hypothetical protein n=1 Tax=Nostoc sp. TaxID=1180 RepID=UPI002FF0DA9F
MLLNQDPVTLYGPNGKVKSIPAVDAPGWLAAGWSLSEVGNDKDAGGLATATLTEVASNLPPTSSPPPPTSSEQNSKQRKKSVAVQEDNGDGNPLPES